MHKKVSEEMNYTLYRELKERIVFLDYEPGRSLAVRELAREFGVSATPIREALIRLEMEGLILSTRNKGAFVSEVGFNEVKDLFEARLHMVRIISKLAALRIRPEELRKMRTLLYSLPEDASWKDTVKLDDKLHEVINVATGNKILEELAENIRSRWTRLWLFIKEPLVYAKMELKDFEKALPAFEAHDAEKCCAILEGHVLNFASNIQNSLLETEFVSRIGAGKERLDS